MLSNKNTKNANFLFIVDMLLAAQVSSKSSRFGAGTGHIQGRLFSCF